MTNTYKLNIGEKVFAAFEKTVTADLFDTSKLAGQIEIAANLAEDMPFVTMPLRQHGILTAGERNTHLLHIFQPNLWAQDFAHTVGKLGTMTAGTAIERANASVDYVLAKSKNIQTVLKRTGTSEYSLYRAMEEAAMIESAYYTRLGGGDMTEVARKKIDVALMRRAIRDESMFQTILRHAGIEETDGAALLQFADEIDLAEILQELVKLDPYFNRRTSQVRSYIDINSTDSVALKHTKTSAFIEELLIRVGRKHPSLFKRIAKTVV